MEQTGHREKAVFAGHLICLSWSSSISFLSHLIPLPATSSPDPPPCSGLCWSRAGIGKRLKNCTGQRVFMASMSWSKLPFRQAWTNTQPTSPMALLVHESESEVTQSCPTLCDPTGYSLPGSSVHGIFQAIVLEWIAISFSRGSSQPRDRTRVSRIVDRRFYHLSHQGSA